MTKRTITVLILLLYLPFLSAEQTRLPDYATVQDNVFWANLYPDGGYTFYCGQRFTNRQQTEAGEALSIEHIVPAEKMTELFQCGSRSACQQNNVPFNHMEADLHNMYPAIARVNSSRQDVNFGIIPGETEHRRFEFCDYERIPGLAEPRPITRGNIARAYFYMMQEYGLQIADDYKEMLKQWNRSDKPTCNELRRNNIIERLQGTRNRFIDLPELADDL